MNLRDQVLAAAETQQGVKNPKLRWDEWNWFFSQITGSTGPAPEPFGFRRQADNPGFLDVDPMTVDFWWSHVCTLVAGGCPEGSNPQTTPTGPSSGDKQPSGGSSATGGSSGGNVFVDTLLTIVGVILGGQLAT